MNAEFISSMEVKARPASQDMVPDDVDLALDPAFPGRAVGRQDVDVEVVVPGERDCLRM